MPPPPTHKPEANEEQMRDLVREVMSEPGLTAPRKDVATIKTQVQQLRSEFASIRSDFMQMLRKQPRAGAPGTAQDAPAVPADYRPEHELAFEVAPLSELLFGRPVPTFSVRFADQVSTQGLPATKLSCAMCQVNSDDEVAQILFGETEVILRGGFAEFSGLNLGRLASIKRGGTFRLRVTSQDPTCPYAVSPLFSGPIDVRTKPSSAAKAAAASQPAPAAAPVPMPPQAAALLKRKPESASMIDADLSPVKPAHSAAAAAGPAGEPVSPRALPSWMERMRPNMKKNRAPPNPVDIGTNISSLTDDLDRVAVSAGYRTGAPSPPPSPGTHGLTFPADMRDLPSPGGDPGMHGADSGIPPPMLGETRQPSSQTLHGALQRLGSSSLMEIAMSVLGHDSMDAIGQSAQSPGKQGDSRAHSPLRAPPGTSLALPASGALDSGSPLKPYNPAPAPLDNSMMAPAMPPNLEARRVLS